MYFKIVLFCAQALMIQSITCQYIGYNGLPFDGMPYGGPLGASYGAPLGAPYGAPLAAPCAGPIAAPYGPWAPELPLTPFAPTNGGSFAVSSTSPLTPSGISVFSENVIEGPLSVGGVLPFLGTVALEAILPTAGAGTVAYGCGSGGVAITAEDYGYPGPYGPGYAGPGYPAYGPGYGYGPGCGAIY